MTANSTVRLVRIAGWLAITAAVLSVPASLTLTPAPAAREYLVPAATTALGAAYVTAPRAWIRPYWIDPGILLGVAAVAAGVAVFGPEYGLFFVLAGIYTAYALRTRAEVATSLVAIARPVRAPGLRPRRRRPPVRELRETLERRQRQYRAFADEAIALATRIRGSARGDPDALDDRLDELAARSRAEERDAPG